MLDYHRVLQIKNDDEGHIELWNKYKPFTEARAQRFTSQVYAAELSKEDYIQDAYFAFLKCIDYIDLSKIKFPERFSFQVVYANFIKNEIERKFFLKKYQKIEGVGYKEEHDSEEDFQQLSGNNILDSDEYTKYHPENLIESHDIDLTSDILIQLFRICSVEERDILDLKFFGFKERDIVDHLNISHSKLSSIWRGLKRKAQKLIEVPAQYD